jgi:hypothetical protein
MLQQHVVALDGLEFLQEPAGHGVFMRIHDGDGAVVAHQPRQRPGLGGLQQQVVAVHVDAVGRGALAGVCAIGVGARNEDDVDALQHGFEQALRQLARQHQQGLAACGLVTVLLADEQHRGTAAGIQRRHVGALGPGEHQRVDGFTPLRQSQVDHLRACRAALRCRQLAQPLGEFGVGGEGAASIGQAGGFVAHRWVGKAGRDGGTVGQLGRRGVHCAGGDGAFRDRSGDYPGARCRTQRRRHGACRRRLRDGSR